MEVFSWGTSKEIDSRYPKLPSSLQQWPLGIQDTRAKRWGEERKERQGTEVEKRGRRKGVRKETGSCFHPCKLAQKRQEGSNVPFDTNRLSTS